MDDVDRSWPGPRTSVPDDLEHAIASALNRFSAENPSNTPDFILAQFLLGCLAAWNQAVQQRETWYGRDARPGSVAAAPARAEKPTTANEDAGTLTMTRADLIAELQQQTDCALQSQAAFQGERHRAEAAEAAREARQQELEKLKHVAAILKSGTWAAETAKRAELAEASIVRCREVLKRTLHFAQLALAHVDFKHDAPGEFDACSATIAQAEAILAGETEPHP